MLPAQEAIIIGGGFYGSAIAIYLAQQRGFRTLTLIEREDTLLNRASYNNQARVHNGYHYPRSFTTAYRSRVNLPRFVRDWPDAIHKNITKIYAIARRNSKVTAKQFERFCRDIGASIRTGDAGVRALFEPRLIEDVFLVDEYAFDSTRLAAWAASELRRLNVRVVLGGRVESVQRNDEKLLNVLWREKNGEMQAATSKYVFNCTYSGLNQLGGDFPGTSTQLKHEITEMALVDVPASLKDVGITVMDGPFFSLMPFPARSLHTLSHVRYTPHLYWQDQAGVDPYEKLIQYHHSTRVDRMIRDVQRYMPSIAAARHVDSLFEIKTVLVKNEGDDGRPILFEKHELLPGCFSVLGGKIDNIYDVLEKLDMQRFSLLDE